ncbi:O-antigen ligase family protein [Georgenia daeguensis]|uniref:O-antigen ligase-related domain-containing protein n=1 Tax=Georgenia daeguensis TaxID=908355 RepID=A0ABP8ESC0_9MICO
MDRLFLATLGVASALIWVGVLVGIALKRRKEAGGQRRPDVPWMPILVVIAWANGVVPSFLNLVIAGRPPVDISASTTLAPPAAMAARFLPMLFVLFCAAALLHEKERPPAVGAGRMCLFLAPWAMGQLATLAAGKSIGPMTLVLLPVLALVAWKIGPPLRDLRIVGILTAVTAAGSLVLWKFAPEVGAVSAPSTGAKAALDQLLAGPYNHPNTLGMALVVGLPAVALFANRRWRFIATVVVVAATWLTGSRTAQFSVALILVAMYVLPRTGRARRGFFLLAAVLLISTLVLIPLTTTDPNAYSERGRIWMTSRDSWAGSPLFGGGVTFYPDTGRYVTAFGSFAFHGHNLFIHFLTTSGIVGAGALVIVVLAAVKASQRYLSRGHIFPAAFVLGFLALAFLEVATDFQNLSTLGFAVWTSLAVILFSHDQVTPTTSAPIRQAPAAHRLRA